eukprot:3551298-Rhodomonas_salina.1
MATQVRRHRTQCAGTHSGSCPGDRYLWQPGKNNNRSGEETNGLWEGKRARRINKQFVGGGRGEVNTCQTAPATTGSTSDPPRHFRPAGQALHSNEEPRRHCWVSCENVPWKLSTVELRSRNPSGHSVSRKVPSSGETRQLPTMGVSLESGHSRSGSASAQADPPHTAPFGHVLQLSARVTGCCARYLGRSPRRLETHNQQRLGAERGDGVRVAGCGFRVSDLPDAAALTRLGFVLPIAIRACPGLEQASVCERAAVDARSETACFDGMHDDTAAATAPALSQARSQDRSWDKNRSSHMHTRRQQHSLGRPSTPIGCARPRWARRCWLGTVDTVRSLCDPAGGAGSVSASYTCSSNRSGPSSRSQRGARGKGGQRRATL